MVEIRRRADRGCDVERHEDAADLPGAEARGAFTLNGLVFEEVFFVSEPALEALSELVTRREPHPPWQYAAELTADGLIDRHFGLTSRGLRALARERHV